MNLFDKKERNAIEEAFISIIRDFDSEHKMFTTILDHGIDKPSYFRNPNFRTIFSIYLSMRNKGIIIMMDSFIDFVRKEYYTDPDKQKKIIEIFLTAYTDRSVYATPLNLEYYLWKFKEHLLQDYWNHVFKLNETGKWKSADMIDISFYIVNGFNELWEKVAKKFEKETESELKNELLERYENNQNGISTSCKTDLTEWDEFTGGFEKGELTIVGARPSMGKTTWALAMVKRIIMRGKIVKIFSYEMSRRQLINRFVSAEMGVPYLRLKKAQLSESELQQALELYDFYDKHPYLIIIQPKDKSISTFNQYMIDNPGDLTVVDYLQLMNGDSKVRKAGNREQEISIVSGNLKEQAMKCDEAIIALSQLNRSSDGRRPTLADLRESGAIEQDADNVVFLHRDAYYQKLKGNSVPDYEVGNTDVIIAKGREIGTENFRMHLDLINTTLEEGWKYSNN